MTSLGRCALSAGIAAMLAGCGGSQPPIGAPGAIRQAPANVGPASAYMVLHRFEDHRIGGADPVAQLIDVNGTLYGTTSTGGLYGDGTVYSITRGGAKKTLYSFRGGPDDGAGPGAGLLDVNGTLYGTTFNGGLTNDCWYFQKHSGCGTVFAITTSGEENVIYRFKGYPDSDNPTSGLIEANRLLYGTTMDTAYSISTSGTETVLHSFAGGNDGLFPEGSLIDVHGALYGTTSEGGSSADGVVYRLTTSGNEKVMYNFTGGSDGWRPSGGLIDLNGTLYGTTAWGGGSGCSNGCGTVYAITTKGKEHVLYRFDDAGGGAWYPSGGLTKVKGTLYGTTFYGGSSKCRKSSCGTVYSVSTSGVEQVLHSFAGDTDGANPIAPLLEVKGTLYGTTEREPGTVFALTP